MYEQCTLHDDFNEKVLEFASAIEKYNTFSLYSEFERLLAVIVVALQALSVINLFQTFHFEGLASVVLTLILAYIVTDFFNGFVHMIVDNNTNYNSIVGPFIAAFHLHHYTMRYQENHAIKIYFNESGHKFWLVIYLILMTFSQKYMQQYSNLNLGLVAFGVFSSFAEVSHYWCHNVRKNNLIITLLQKCRILLSLKHHRLHHTQDNTHYAFLNGISDPLLNSIARTCYKGYKNRSDKHVATYMKKSVFPTLEQV